MPTGIEIGGLVLGVIGAYPTVISALDLYIGALQARSKSHEILIQALKHELGWQYIKFKNSYCILMDVRDPSDILASNLDWQSISDCTQAKITSDEQWKIYGELLEAIHGCWNRLSIQIPTVSCLKFKATALPQTV